MIKKLHSEGNYDLELDEVPPHFHNDEERCLIVRLIQPDDAPLLLDLFEHLSSDTRRRRFHVGVDHLSEERKQTVAKLLASVDNLTQGGALLAIDPNLDGGTPVAVARLARPENEPDADIAEAAIVVRDDYQKTGIGTELLWRLVLLAKRMNVKTMLAEIEADNGPAIQLFRALDLPTHSTTRHAETIMHITMPIGS